MNKFFSLLALIALPFLSNAQVSYCAHADQNGSVTTLCVTDGTGTMYDTPVGTWDTKTYEYQVYLTPKSNNLRFFQGDTFCFELEWVDGLTFVTKIEGSIYVFTFNELD